MKIPTLIFTLFAILLWSLTSLANNMKPDSESGARVIYPPYTEQKLVFEFFFDHPQKIASALYWLRSVMRTLGEEPYGYAPDYLDIKVVIHGTEIVTLATKNYKKYTEVVERMRYYAELGVEFKICALAAEEFGYQAVDFHDFVDIVPSALTEIAHWQLQGHALIIPKVWEKKFSIDEIQ